MERMRRAFCDAVQKLNGSGFATGTEIGQTVTVAVFATDNTVCATLDAIEYILIFGQHAYHDRGTVFYKR